MDTISGTLGRTYGYDAAGNTLSYAGATFTYNNRGRMATASNAGVTATYTYNALGQRVRRATAGVGTLYVYDEAGHLAGEYSASGSLVQETVWLGDTPIATLRPDGSGGVVVYYVHTDHLNTPRLVTDTSNNVRWRWDSDAFGSTPPNQNPGGLGIFEYHLRFPGQQFDAVVGLHYNYFRDYDPATGRYAQSDPIGLRGGPNTYAYANGNPAILADPLGLLALGWSETWKDSDNLGGKNRGGYTEGWIENVKCGCQGSGSCWTLVDCSALLHVKVQILASAWGDEDKFYRRSEAEHVADFRANFGKIYAAGKAAEDSVKGMQFSSKAACEAHANKAVSAALWKAANEVAKASGKTYDETGRHTWHWYYRLF